MKRCLSLAVLSSLLVTGCSSFDYSKIQYQPFLTRQEVVDYYANQMSYDSIVKRTAVRTNKIEWNKVPEDIQDKLWQETTKVLTTYQLNDGYEGEMTRYVHDNLKLTLDDLVLSAPDGGFSYTEAESRGYYFVTVYFTTQLNTQGSLKGEANYIGVNGAIIDGTSDGVEEVPVLDTNFMNASLAKINEYRVKNHLEPYPDYGSAFTNNAVEQVQEQQDTSDAEGNAIVENTEDSISNEEVINQTATPNKKYIASSLNFVNSRKTASSMAKKRKPVTNQTEESTTETVEESQLDESISSADTETMESSETEPSTDSALSTETENTRYSYVDNSEDAINDSYANNVRQLLYDVKLFNKVVGSSHEQMACVPYVSMVYNPVEPQGSLSGYGIFSEGAYGLKDFGYDRTKYGTGTMKITFVFKQNPQRRDRFDYSYCYINEYKTNISLEDKDVTQSSYIDGMLDVVIERADRAFSNKDSAGLMSKEIYEPSDLGLRELELRNSSNVLAYMTKRVKTLDRKNKEYLVELERTSELSPKGLGTTARYKDKYYAVIRQDGVEFKINDIVWVSRDIERIPEPNSDDSIIRRLTSLNLSGDVSEQAKIDINDMFKKLSIGVNEKRREDSVGEDGKPVYGVYGRFDSDTSLLSTEKSEYLKSKLTTRLNRFGSDKNWNLNIRVAEWLGGYNDQVELETEELYTYEGLDKGIYVKNYYLVSHYGKEWVIDDIIAIEENEVSGAELEQLKQSFK
jgi:lipoprotein